MLAAVSPNNEIKEQITSPPTYRTLFTTSPWKEIDEQNENQQTQHQTNFNQALIPKDQTAVTSSLSLPNSAMTTVTTNAMVKTSTSKELSVVGLPPPKASMLTSSISATAQNQQQNQISSSVKKHNWIIVSGIDTSSTTKNEASLLLKQFQTYGVILEQMIGPNYIYLNYETSLQAEKALAQNWTLFHQKYITTRKLNSVPYGKAFDGFLKEDIVEKEEEEDVFLKDNKEGKTSTKSSEGVISIVLSWIFNW